MGVEHGGMRQALKKAYPELTFKDWQKRMKVLRINTFLTTTQLLSKIPFGGINSDAEHSLTSLQQSKDSTLLSPRIGTQRVYSK